MPPGAIKSWLIPLIAIAAVAAVLLMRVPRPESAAPVPASPPAVQQAKPDYQVIETQLLPLRLTADRISARAEIAPGGGAIEQVGGALLIMDRLGKLFAYKDGKISAIHFPELPIHMKDYSDDARFPATEGNLRAHDIAYDKEENYLYASYDSYDKAARAPRFAISRIALSGNALQPKGDWEPVYITSPVPLRDYYAGRGAGGKMLIVKRSLYFTVGDYSLDRIVSSPADIAAQNPQSPFGKTYRYDLQRKSLKRMSMGHRVPQGLASTSSGQILETEHGPRGGDELNVITEGANYGWPYVSYGTRYFSYKPYLDAMSFKKKLTEPVFGWVPSIAVTALFESSRFDPAWNGNIIVGSLKAQSLFRLKMVKGRVVFSEPVWIGHRVRDLLEQDGRIVVWTDDGSLIFVTPERSLLEADRLNVEEGYKVRVLSSCSTCHSLASHNQFYWAPTLRGIYGAKIAGDNFQNYSAALRSKAGVWEEATLMAFLMDPQNFAPGTTMINPDLTAAQITEVIKALKALSHQ